MSYEAEEADAANNHGQDEPITARQKALAGSRGPEFAADLAKRLGIEGPVTYIGYESDGLQVYEFGDP